MKRLFFRVLWPTEREKLGVKFSFIQLMISLVLGYIRSVWSELHTVPINQSTINFSFFKIEMGRLDRRGSLIFK